VRYGCIIIIAHQVCLLLLQYTSQRSADYELVMDNCIIMVGAKILRHLKIAEISALGRIICGKIDGK
jgi:hypothetical protein